MKNENAPELPETDRDFLAAFEGCEIDANEFHHRQHVRLAYIYLTLYSFDEALERMEAGLLRLLEHLGAPASKYHRTLTQSWLLAVQHFMASSGPTAGFEQFADKAGALLDKDIMGTHYTPNLLWSQEARASFAEPDLQPFPPPPSPPNER